MLAPRIAIERPIKNETWRGAERNLGIEMWHAVTR